MCGIVGFLDKRARPDYPVGQTLLTMLRALGCRGPDSAGVALFQEAGTPHLNLSVPPRVESRTVLAVLDELQLSCQRRYPGGVYAALADGEVDAARLEEQLAERLPGVEVICMGRRLTLFKQVGSPDELEVSYQVSALTGTHGIGHTRLSTESRVDLSHSQPFWAHGVPDLATVHNGHITNYHKLRRYYEHRGHHFHTDNDSEVIGVYLRERLAAGMSLADALHASQQDIDGSFCYLVASADCLACVKDRYSFKPLVLAQTEDFVAIATEEIALRRALPGAWAAREPAPGSVLIWPVHQLQPA
jgi:glutamate synthase domain-containing protein 1